MTSIWIRCEWGAGGGHNFMRSVRWVISSQGVFEKSSLKILQDKGGGIGFRKKSRIEKEGQVEYFWLVR